MSGVPNRKRGGARGWVAGAVLLTAAWAATARAQAPAPAGAPAVGPAAPAADGHIDSQVIQAGCPGCPGGNLPSGVFTRGDKGDDSGCGCGPCKGCGCIPGQPKCYCECWNDADNCVTKFFAGVYNCICCPDPCYEPHWCALRDAAFFQDAARPVTQMKLTWDEGWNFKNPDRAEFFWARERTNPNQIGPGGPCTPSGLGKGPSCVTRRLDYDTLWYTTEAAQGAAGISISVPYLHTEPTAGRADALLSGYPQPANEAQRNLAQTGMVPPGLPPDQAAAAMAFLTGPAGAPGVPGAVAGAGCCPESGFGDIIIGTKAMLLDCDCIQITFGFKTYLPTGNFLKGLGTGHVSLEPSLIFGLPLCQGCFLQMQHAYWIPVGGDPLYESDVYHGHYAINHDLWCPCPGLKLVGTMELNHWVVFNGNYTEPEFLITVPGVNGGRASPVAQPGGASIISVGPGVRFVICDKIDFGVGSAFAVTGQHWADQLVRAEFRWRF